MKKIVFVFLLIGLCSFSQENRKVFYGVISDDLGSLSRVHIINTNTQKATYSNDKGQFKIFAQVNDSLKFTSVGYKTNVLKVSSKHFGIHENQIHLDKEIIELDEIEVKDNNLTGLLSTDIKSVKTTKEVDEESLKLPNVGNKKLTVAERRLYTATGGQPFKIEALGATISVDYIINVISGRLKKLKTEKKIEDNEKQIKSLKNLFTNYITQDLQIDSTDVYRFIYFCQEDKSYKIQQQKGEFTVIEFLKEKATEFKKLNEKL